MNIRLITNKQNIEIEVYARWLFIESKGFETNLDQNQYNNIISLKSDKRVKGRYEIKTKYDLNEFLSSVGVEWAMVEIDGSYREEWKDGAFVSIITKGFQLKGLSFHQDRMIFGSIGNIKDWSIERINKRIQEINDFSMENKLPKIPYCKRWSRDNTIFFGG